MAIEDEDQELGPPVAELAMLTEEPTEGFLARVKSAIERRRLGSHATSLAWHGVILVALELVAALFSSSRTPAREDDAPKDPPEPTA